MTSEAQSLVEVEATNVPDHASPRSVPQEPTRAVDMAIENVTGVIGHIIRDVASMGEVNPIVEASKTEMRQINTNAQLGVIGRVD